MFDQPLPATLTLEAATRQAWDLAIIGAGPAGAIAARAAALAGAAVLLVDRATFPRHKVCGCCLNGAALEVLAEAGLADLPDRCHAPPLRAFHLASGGRFARLPLAAGVSLSRARLDAELIQAAIAAGVQFLDDTQALVGEYDAGSRRLELKRTAVAGSASAKVIVIASGLGARVFAQPHSEQRQASRGSRVGAGAVIPDANHDFAGGTIFMACHRDGYVGLVRLEDGQLDIAAALDSAAIKQQVGIAPLVARILRDAGLPVPAMALQTRWHGTGRLTQQRQHVAGDGYFVVGDAAGYVEPFTGEGMAWALATGRAVVPFAMQALNGNRQAAQLAWSEQRNALIGRRARRCRTVSTLLRYPALVNLTVRLLARAPVLARPMIKSLNASFATSGSKTAAEVSYP